MTSNDLLSSLDQYIDRFQKSLPSSIKDEEVIELERLINNLYLDQLEKGCSSDLEEAIIDALGWASAMVNEIKRNEESIRGQDYYKTFKKLANQLKSIRYYVR